MCPGGLQSCELLTQEKSHGNANNCINHLISGYLTTTKSLFISFQIYQSFKTLQQSNTGIIMDIKEQSIHTLGAFTLLTSRFLKSQHFDPTIYTCAKTREVS